jgi:nucleoside-diphosphate-sugar epimerase
MKVVVLGATGNVGSALTERLGRDPEITRVVGASRREPEALPSGVDWQPLDLGQDLPTSLFQDADAVVHLAWLFQPTHQPATTWSANVEGTGRVLQAAESAGVRTLVYASSVGAYSARTSEAPVDESWPTHGVPTAAYSREKAYVERMLDAFEVRNPGIRVVRMRPAFTFQEEAAVQQRRLFAGPLVPAKLFRKIRLPVLPDPGGLTLQTVHTDDVAQAYHLALTREVHGAFNLAAEPTLDIPAIGEILGVPVRRVPASAARAGLAAAWAAHLVPASPGLFDLLAQVPVMGTTRAREELGWEPQNTAVEAFQSLLAGIETGEGGPTPPLDPDTSGRLRGHEFGTGVGEEP